jgi:DNA/RNA-binding protein KIN17
LGKVGLCTIDRTEKGWYLTYIDRDPEVMARQEMIAQKERMEANDELDQNQRIEKMEEHAKEILPDLPLVAAPTEIQVTDNKLEFKFSTTLATQQQQAKKATSGLFDEPVVKKESDEKEKAQSISVLSQKRALPFASTPVITNKKPKIEEKHERKIEEPIEEDVRDYWIAPNLIVKIMNQKIGDGQFYGKKAIITKVNDLYVAVVKILDSGIIIKIDQSHLETVIPAIGAQVAIVNGKYRGKNGILKSVDFDNFKAVVKVDGKEVEKEYEEICKI